MYSDFLNVKNKKLVYSTAQFGGQKGLRIDLIMELQLKEDNIELILNAGKTFKIENMYRYVPKSASKNIQNTLNRSAVFRPNGNQEE